MKNKGVVGRGLGIGLMVLSGIVSVSAQELRCQVEVNSQKIEGTNKSVFESLQQSINDYMNENRFTTATFSPTEKIDCRLFLTVGEYDGDRIKGDLQVQLSRPVYNSTYTTTVFNFKDNRVEFDYKDGDPLIFNETSQQNNLTAILDYYAYLFLALDFDTFSPEGGQAYYDRAASIVQAAQSTGEIGWKAFEDTKNRSAVLSAYTDPATSGMRRLLYNYYRKGLDEMVTSPDKGRATITESLKDLQSVYKNAPMSVGLSIFRDSKLDELVNIYSKAPSTERDEAYEILEPIYPTDRERLDKIKKGSEQ
ncbi:MAG: DUF4835 family protein [Bacteroides sp.]|nr:DUF4835 family protein [Bacteroidales bacterium]MBD5295304.1 DUF4835 family protein [Bacteroides sp.]MDE6234809.1 DUF4835 family protein [Muribaculaceae bacterium]